VPRSGWVLQGQLWPAADPAADPAAADPAAVTPPTPVVLDPEPVQTEDVTVLAYICRGVPRCPDPDESLDWPLTATADPAQTGRTHVVVKGETLAGIAKRYYGDARRWPEIAQRNHVTDPGALRIGQRLSIP
jgi:nucleoid-associated protein YgaU